jgi:hypothetical protein
MAEKNQTQKVDYVALKVTSGILIHIGAGIYNSIAGALKELVSNSYDADATSVTISTDYPYFNQIKIVDNGLGMSSRQLRRAMQSIGSSLKNLQDIHISKKYQRPIIGQLGIGLMALSQVCKKARIESQEPDADTKLVAELDFSQFKEREEGQMLLAKLEVFKERYGGIEVMDDIIDDPTTDEDFRLEVQTDKEIAMLAQENLEKLKEKDGPKAELKGEHLGYCVIYPSLPARPGEMGTTITLTEIDKEVNERLRDKNRDPRSLPTKYHGNGDPWGVFRDDVNSWGWNEFSQRLQLGTSNLKYSDLPYYHQFLWELSVMTPVTYLPGGPVLIDSSILKNKKQELADYKFALTVDKHELLKPVLLPSGTVAKESTTAIKELDYNIKKIAYEGMVDGHPLKYGGYLYWQKEQNKPNMIQGLQIYIKNVGIGLYDRTLLNYDKVNPGSRIPQISGEIYVDDGLERALSVDRSTFRDTDPHYAHIKNHIWSLLGVYKDGGTGLLGASVRAYYKRRDQKEEKLFIEHIKYLKRALASASDNKLKLRVSRRTANEPYIVEKNEIVLNDASPSWPKRLRERMTAQRILLSITALVERGAKPKEILKQLEHLLLDVIEDDYEG